MDVHIGRFEGRDMGLVTAAVGAPSCGFEDALGRFGDTP
jgi:hypothetical protein